MNSQDQQLANKITNNTNLNKLGVSGGSRHLEVTTAHTGLSGTTIQPREDTVIGTCTGVNSAGGAVNFLTLFNISGVTLKVSDLFVAPSGFRITNVTITSGSIILHQ